MIEPSKDEDEGLWFYGRQGNLIRHVNRPRCYFPEYSASSVWWFEEVKMLREKHLHTDSKDGSKGTMT
jgi:hypothetical protein